MGLLGNLGKNFANGSLFDGFAAAQAALAGDYGGMAQINSAAHKRRADDEEDRQKQEALKQLHATIDSDPALSPQDKAYAKANPKAYIEHYMSRFEQRQFGPGGGSVSTPAAGGQTNWQTAPRFDDDGNIYAPGNGTSAPEILQRGTKAVPVTAGGEVKVLDALSGAPLKRSDVQARSGMFGGMPPSAPRIGQVPLPPMQSTFKPGQVVNGYIFKGGDDTDESNWEKVGGAGSGPRTFPRSY